MKRLITPILVSAAVLFTAIAVRADNATMHGMPLIREGTAVRVKNFDVTLDGRLLTADEGLYHPETGVVELTGNVVLHFGSNVRSFPGEIR